MIHVPVSRPGSTEDEQWQVGTRSVSNLSCQGDVLRAASIRFAQDVA
jgi:hypothetical protein